MNSIAHRLALAYPEADKDVGVSMLSMKQDIVGKVQPFLIVLLAAVAFLLLIACANVASLLLVRSMRRSGEFALRSALGAGRGRIIRQLLTESALLAGLGGTFGFLLAFFGARDHHQPSAQRTATLRRSFYRCAGTALHPRHLVSGRNWIWHRSRTQVVACQSGAGSPSKHQRRRRRSFRLQGLFVAAEIAMALVLLVGAGLMLRSLVACGA